jgi:peptide-methionine (S)-S-oxide reductase
VQVHYTGTLDDGDTFDSSKGRDPLAFVVGAGEVIPGFDDAVSGLPVGGTRKERVTADRAYGVLPALSFPAAS